MFGHATARLLAGKGDRRYLGRMPEVEGRGLTAFLFSDIEGSTRLWERFPDQMSDALQRHDDIVTGAFAQCGGVVFSIAGDSFGAAFSDLADAATAALTIQSSLAGEPWPAETPIRARLGLHLGVAQLRNDNFFGPAVNRAARIMASAHGGQLLLSARAAELLEDDHRLVDLGLHHLKDLAEPEHIWQLGLEEHQPPRTTRDAGNIRLPEPTSSLIGRSEDQARVSTLLAESQAVALVGPGGIGKTQLALAVAIEAQPNFEDGVVFADLGDVSNDDDVPDVVAASIGVRQGPGQTISETLADWYRHKSALLVLDNCDAVFDGALAVLHKLADRCPGLRFLVTVRRRLEHPVVVVHTVDPLRSADAKSLLVERISAVDGGFEASSHQSGLAQLAARLDGVPLAIELAAARCRGLTPEQLTNRLDSRPGLLVDAERQTRHRSVEATLESSVDTLSDDHQLIFSRCSAFLGPFDLEAAEAVISDDDTGHPGSSQRIAAFDVVDALMALVDASLLQRLPSGAFRMLAPVRDVATGRRAVNDPSLTRHINYFQNFALRAGQGVDGPDEAVWAEAVRVQFPNLRAAHERALAEGAVDISGDIVFGLWRHAFDRMQFELLRWCDDTLRIAVETDSPRAVAACLAASTASFVHIGRFNELDRAIERLESLGEVAMPYLPVAYGMQAVALGNQAKAEEAFAMAEQTRVAATKAGNKWLVAMPHVFTRDFEAAVSFCRKQQNPTLWSWFHLFRGFSRQAEGRLKAAEHDFTEGETLARSVGNTHALGAARNELGIVAAQANDRSLSDTLLPLDQAIEIFERLRTPLQLWNSLEVLAQAFARKKLYEQAFTIWAAIDAENARPASIVHRPDLGAVDLEEHADARDAGAVLDLWQVTEFGRRAIRLAIGETVTEPQAA